MSSDQDQHQQGEKTDLSDEPWPCDQCEQRPASLWCNLCEKLLCEAAECATQHAAHADRIGPLPKDGEDVEMTEDVAIEDVQEVLSSAAKRAQN